MKKLTAILLLAVLLISGCANTEPQTPNTMPPSVMIDGTLYQTTGKQMPGEVDPSAIAGAIDETVSPSTLPEENGQSNFGEAGMKYAFTQDGLVVLTDNEWTLFEPQEQQ